MRKYVVLGVLLILLIAEGVIWYKDNNSGGEAVINQKKIISATKPGEVTFLTEIADLNQSLICALYPYENEVLSDTPQAERINQYLRKINYVGDEGHWSLVFIDDREIRISIFKYGKVAILGEHQLREKDRLSIPVGFEQARWAESKQAAFYKLKRDNCEYLIFGRAN